MLDFHVRIISLLRHLEPTPDQREQLFVETLLWPEINTFGNRAKQVLRQQLALAEQLVRQGDPAELHERQIPEDPETGRVTFRVEPVPGSGATWREPVELTLPLIVWSHEAHRIAFIPELGIEIVAESEQDLVRRVEEEARIALLRGGHGRDLVSLALLQRTRQLEVVSSVLNLYPETPRERWDRESAEPVAGSELAKVAVRLTPERMPVAWHRESAVENLARLLTGRRATSVLLVGPPGVGKTAIFQELVRRRADFKLENRPFWRTSGARLVSGMSGFGDWQERCQKVAAEARDQDAILHFGNLAELLESGRAGGKTDNIAAFFRPKIVRGELHVVLECTADQLAAVEKRDPRVLDGLRQIVVEEPDAETSRAILREAARAMLGEAPDPDALLRVDTLHRRYSGYSAYPGKPLRFLQQLVRESGGEGIAGTPSPFTLERVNQAFSSETGLPLVLLEDAIPLDLGETRAWFARRLMGQDRAAEVVIDTIATVKARLSRPGKPLASFLFVGPTGVGKTELAKCLAEFFYGSRERMIRLDMSEYNTPLSATRLVSDLGQDQEGLLTAQLRDQPFSLVLLDEFEKAHPAVFDLFLQVLGEARLTDGAGRVADFSNALVIMTSNLGAAEYRAGAKLGFGDRDAGAVEAESHFVGEAKKRFRPEFFNRIDHIVPFAPLDRDQLRRIVGKEVEGLQRRDGIRERHLRLTLEPEVIDRVLERGFDPRYGARPLRRQLGLEVLRPVAEALNQAPTREAGEIRVGLNEVRVIKESGAAGRRDVPELEWISAQRRRFQRLCRASFVGELASERYRLNRAAAYLRRGGKSPGGDAKEVHARLESVNGLLDGLEARAGAVARHEEAVLLGLVGHGTGPEAIPEIGAHDYEDLLFALYAAAEKSPARLTLVFQADEPAHLHHVATDYHALAGFLDCRCRVGIYPRKPGAEDWDADRSRVRPRIIPEELVDVTLAGQGEDPAAVALEMSGPLSFLWFRGEAGGHGFELEEQRGGKKKYRVLVHALETELEESWFDGGKLRQGIPRGLSVHRHYNLARGTWKDDQMGVSGHELFSPDLLERIVRQRLLTRVEQAL